MVNDTCPKCKTKRAVTIYHYNYICRRCGYELNDEECELYTNPTLNDEELDWVNSIGWSG